jgi:hypothetical protein
MAVNRRAFLGAQGRPGRPVGGGGNTGIGARGGIKIGDGLTVMGPALTGGTVTLPVPFPVIAKWGVAEPTNTRPGPVVAGTRPGPVMVGTRPTTGSPPLRTPGMAGPSPGSI